MLKKFVRFIRFLLIGFVWTYLFLICANVLMYTLWNFNMFSARSWQIINAFWEAGGVIKSGKDYVFLSMICALPLFWGFGWSFFAKVSYTNVLLAPLNIYNRRVIKKYGQNSSRVVLRNLKSSQKVIEEIKGQLAAIKPEKAKEVQNIRNQINQTISEEISKE